MAERTFTFREGWKEAIKALPDVVRLDVYDAIVGIAFGDNVEGLKPMAEIALNFIKPQIEDEFRHKEAIAERNRRNGAKHIAKQQQPEKPAEQGDLDKQGTTQENPNNPVAFLASQERKEAKEILLFSNENSNEFCLGDKSACADVEKADTPQPTKTKRVRKTDKDPEMVRLNSEAKELFKTIYLEKFGSPYAWTGADAGQMSNLLSYIRVSRTERKKPLPVDTDSLLEALGEFLRAIKDEWVLNHFTVKVIASKYNEIVAMIKRQRQQYGPANKQDARAGSNAPDPNSGYTFDDEEDESWRHA